MWPVSQVRALLTILAVRIIESIGSKTVIATMAENLLLAWASRAIHRINRMNSVPRRKSHGVTECRLEVQDPTVGAHHRFFLRQSRPYTSKNLKSGPIRFFFG
jgi:hypothetical protein